MNVTKPNKGVGGVDKMSVDELLPYLKENKDKLLEQLLLGKYKPQPVRRVEIPKEEKGKVRKLGIPTVVDRVIQQAIMQVLTHIYEPQFSDNSYGFRANRGAHNALRKCQEYADEGYCYVVDMDLEKFKTKYRMIRGIIFQSGKCMSWQIVAGAHGEPH